MAERVECLVPTYSKSATDEFVEAVAIAQLTRLIATPQFPLGHLRQNKMIYFAHRKADENVREHFSKQPAGPYSPWAKYQGPEKIAQQNGYVKRTKMGGFVMGQNIDKIDRYVSALWDVCNAINWVVNEFRCRKNEELELLSTVDFAVLDLIRIGATITKDAVKNIIAANPKWAPLLDRYEIFSDEKIKEALRELSNLFPDDLR